MTQPAETRLDLGNHRRLLRGGEPGRRRGPVDDHHADGHRPRQPFAGPRAERPGVRRRQCGARGPQRVQDAAREGRLGCQHRLPVLRLGNEVAAGHVPRLALTRPVCLRRDVLVGRPEAQGLDTQALGVGEALEQSGRHLRDLGAAGLLRSDTDLDPVAISVKEPPELLRRRHSNAVCLRRARSAPSAAPSRAADDEDLLDLQITGHLSFLPPAGTMARIHPGGGSGGSNPLASHDSPSPGRSGLARGCDRRVHEQARSGVELVEDSLVALDQDGAVDVTSKRETGRTGDRFEILARCLQYSHSGRGARGDRPRRCIDVGFEVDDEDFVAGHGPMVHRVPAESRSERLAVLYQAHVDDGSSSTYTAAEDGRTRQCSGSVVGPRRQGGAINQAR